MEKYVIVPDSFKGTLSSAEVCAALAEEIRAARPEAQIVALPVADGGEGSVDAFLTAVGGEKKWCDCRGPYGAPLRAFYGLLPDGTVVVEMAAAAGLPLVGERLDPEKTTTYGVGELMACAVREGAERIILALGGSATNDGGCGMAAALGVKFYNAAGETFVPTGGTLTDIARIDVSQRLTLPMVTVMCDIDNPLCGPAGAAAVFGPQKGADGPMVERLDAGLRHMAALCLRDLGADVLELLGAGAAGGMGGGAVAYLDGKLQMGIETVLDVTGFTAHVQDAAMVFTGEGRLDGQSLRGKVVAGVARRAKAAGVPVVAVVGAVGEDADGIYDQGVSAVFSINHRPEPLDVSGPHSRDNLRRTVRNVMGLLDAAGKKR